jgi:hypothetical protein
VLAELNHRFDVASRVRVLRDLDHLEAAIRDDWEAQRKITNAFTTYLAKGNREDLA